MPELVCQAGQLPRFALHAGTSRELIARRVEPASKGNRPGLVLDQVDNQPIAVPQVDVLVPIDVGVDPQLVDTGFQTSTPLLLCQRVRHVQRFVSHGCPVRLEDPIGQLLDQASLQRCDQLPDILGLLEAAPRFELGQGRAEAIPCHRSLPSCPRE